MFPPNIETIILPPINWYVCSILLNTWTTLSLSNGWRGLAIFEPQYIEFTLGIYKSNGLFLVFWDNSLLNSIFLRPAHFAANRHSTFRDCCKALRARLTTHCCGGCISSILTMPSKRKTWECFLLSFTYRVICLNYCPPKMAKHWRGDIYPIYRAQ